MFQPDPLTLTASQASLPLNVTIVTTADTLATPARRLQPPSDWTNQQGILVFGLLVLSLVLFRARLRRAGCAASACLLLVVLTSLAGCTNGSTSTTTTFNGTPPGTYAVTISGLGITTANTPSTFTLIVTAH
jgi:hypothetical protein